MRKKWYRNDLCKNIILYQSFSKIDPTVQCRNPVLEMHQKDNSLLIYRLGVPCWTKYQYKYLDDLGIEKHSDVYLCFWFLSGSIHLLEANCCPRIRVSPWKHGQIHSNHGQTSNWWVRKQTKIKYWNCRGVSSLW